MAVKRYPWAPLRRLIVLRVGARTTEQGVAFEQAGVPFIADMLGVDRKQIHRWAATGLDRWQADDAAVRAGLLPQLVWPEWMDDSIADLPPDVTRVCVARGCETTFVVKPQHPRKRFCSPRCRSRETMRAAYQRDPAPRRESARRRYNPEEQRRRNADYYRLNRQRAVDYQAAYYQANKTKVKAAHRARRQRQREDVA